MRASGKPTRYVVRQAASRSVERRACPRSDMDQPLLPLPVRGTAFRRHRVSGCCPSYIAPEAEPSTFERCHLHIAASRPGDRINLLAAAHESFFGPTCTSGDVRFPASVEGKADLSAFRPRLGYLDADRLAPTVRPNSLQFKFRKQPGR